MAPRQKTEDPGYLTIGKAAQRLGISTQTLRNAERTDSGPPFITTPGGHRRYRLVDLDSYLYEAEEEEGR